MITGKDSDYHARDPKEWRWTETTPLIFAVPSEGILANLYVASRPNLGVALSAICVVKGLHMNAHRVDFVDAQMHLPAPDNFVKYELENGLKVDVFDPPRGYRFQYAYKGGDECYFDVTFRGLHRPFDCEDPAENPLLAKPQGSAYDSRLGDQWGNRSTDATYASGHFNTIGHATGELVLRGKRYKVDSYDCMDHSWSRRTEVSRRSVCYLSACFGDDYGIHVAVPMEMVDGRMVYEDVRFGFVMEDGETYGVTACTIEATEIDLMPSAAWVTVTDIRGKVHRFSGGVIAGHPWDNFNPSHIAFQALMRWETPDGRVGFSEMANIFGREFLSARLSPSGRG